MIANSIKCRAREKWRLELSRSGGMSCLSQELRVGGIKSFGNETAIDHALIEKSFEPNTAKKILARTTGVVPIQL